MQPSTQVVHIPLNGLIESSVRFLVSVAAEALRCVKVMAVSPLFLQLSKIRFHPDVRAKWAGNFAGVTGIEETHRLVVTLEALRGQVGAAVAKRRLGIRALAPQFTNWTDVQACATLAASFAGHVKRTGDLAIQPSPGEANRSGHHLVLAHAHAKAALNTRFALGFVAALLDAHRGC